MKPSEKLQKKTRNVEEGLNKSSAKVEKRAGSRKEENSLEKSVKREKSKKISETEERQVNLVSVRESQRLSVSREKNRVRKSSQEAEISKKLKEKRTQRNNID